MSADSEATLTVSLAFPSASPGVPTLPHADLVRVPFTVQAHTQTLVANGTEASEAITLDQGSIATQITGFLLINHTGQDLLVAMNTDTVSATLPDGGMMSFATPVAAADAIAGITLTTTATQSGNRTVEAWLFGDP